MAFQHVSTHLPRLNPILIAVDTSIRTFGTIVETRHGASLHK
ncbi:hypothetical protein MC7420_7872 [Coleofasciculus chthonoplastes PCC 7420]|uniref:Uncharacterized protein n=1 Tax=Coleofasciculus chthonoplastes PCC 7420 TaxID=118168 RepID=B4VIY3_9CYAN|nr:hypothetical protein MC7420_7872 [Coleofasciculus chthonoplastes PCC 7420]